MGGVGLCVAIAMELGDLKGAKDGFAKLPSDLDLRLAFQPLGLCGLYLGNGALACGDGGI